MPAFANRRQLLQLGAFGLGLSLGLPEILRAKASSGRAKSAILVYLPGGPSQLDTFDPKPDAPAEIRGPFGTIPTSVPGVRFSEHLPLLAGMLDKFAVLRAVTGMGEEHLDVQVMTGYSSPAVKQSEHPSIGAVVSKLRGTGAGVPPFVTLRGQSAGCHPGFLGVAHQPFNPGGEVDADLKLSAEVPAARFAERLQLLAGLDRARRDRDARGAMAGFDQFQQQAHDLIKSGKLRTALSIGREPEQSLVRYNGVEIFLKARRLIEAGVGCVTLAIGDWDTHKDNFKTLQQTLPLVDRGLAALFSDLFERGLAEDVVVLVWGEFGRTPKINAAAGRDHWSPVMSALLAGGGLERGTVIGATNAWAEEPREGACSVQQVLATVYRAIGIDPGTTLRNGAGRPVYLVENRAAIKGL